MIGVGSQNFNLTSFITRIGDDKVVIILPEEDHVLYLTPVDPTNLTSEKILAL